MKSYLTYALIAVACVAVFAAGHFSGLYGWKATRSDSRELFTQNALAFSLSGVMEIGRTSPENWKNLAAYDDPEWARAHMPEINWVPGVALAPLIGASPAPGNYGTATISPDQFRYAKPIVKPKPEGTFRLFLVGGSTAYGSGATSNAATIGGYLEFILGTVAPRRKIEVITAAYPAWGSSQELAALLFRIMSQYAPDMVISFSGFNDCYWSISGRNTLFFRTFGDGFIDNVWRLSHKLAAAGAPVEIVPRSLDGPVAPAVAAKRLVRNVDLMAYAIQRQGGVFYFVLQPSIFWTKKQLSPNEKNIPERISTITRNAAPIPWKACKALRIGTSNISILPGSSTHWTKKPTYSWTGCISANGATGSLPNIWPGLLSQAFANRHLADRRAGSNSAVFYFFVKTDRRYSWTAPA